MATNFYSLRVEHDKGKYEEFMDGFTPLDAREIAGGAVCMLEQPLHVSVKTMDIVPTGKSDWSYGYVCCWLICLNSSAFVDCV